MIGKLVVYDVVPGTSAPLTGQPDGAGRNMGRRVLVIVLVLVVGLFAYLGYTSYDAKRAGLNGDVYSTDSSIGKTKAGAGSPGAAPSAEQTVVYPPPVAQAIPAKPQTPPNDAGDTINPNPPNGMSFSGTGKYQLYRQGNLTWRLNTETGQTCVVFATDEEWKKPKVYRAGCGSR